MTAEVIQVIRSTDRTLGDGTEKHPFRQVVRYYTLDGQLLWECDPITDHPPPKREEPPGRGD